MKLILIFVREYEDKAESLTFAMIADSKEEAIEEAKKHLAIMYPDEEILLFSCIDVDDMF